MKWMSITVLAINILIKLEHEIDGSLMESVLNDREKKRISQSGIVKTRIIFSTVRC